MVSGKQLFTVGWGTIVHGEWETIVHSGVGNNCPWWGGEQLSTVGWGTIVHGGVGNNCPRWGGNNCPRWKVAGWTNVLVSKCPKGNCLQGAIVCDWQLSAVCRSNCSRWQVSRGVIVQGGKCPEGNCSRWQVSRG